MASFYEKQKLKNQEKSILNSAEEDNKVSQVESILAGVGSGLIQIPKGIFSLGATLMDLGADTNKAAAVEQWFDDLTTWDEKAAATTAGKITELLVNIGVPGGIGFKIGTKLATTALQAKKAKKYFQLVDKANNKVLVDSVTKLAKLNTAGRATKFAAGAITGGAMEGVFIGDVEAAGTFGNFLGGPTELHETVEGDRDPARALANRVKFGTEGALFTGLIGGLGKTLRLLGKRNEAMRYADNKIDKKLFDMLKKFQKEGGTTKEFFKQQREMIGQKYGDINAAQQFSRNLNKNINGLFPFMQRMMDSGTKANRKGLLAVLNDSLISGTPRVGDDGVVKFGEKRVQDWFNPLTGKSEKLTTFGGIGQGYRNKVKSFLKQKKIAYTPKQLDDIFSQMENIRGGWAEMFSALGKGIKANVKTKAITKQTFKDYKKMFGNKFKDYLGATYEVFQNRSLIPLFAKPVSTEVAEKAAREFMKIAKTNNKPISWQEALTAVDNIAESALPPTNFNKDVWIDVPHFFTRKSFYDKSLDITHLSVEQRKVVEGILGKTKNPVQTILAATGEISAITRRNQLMQGMIQNSANALKSYKNGLRPLFYESMDQVVKKSKELNEAAVKAGRPAEVFNPNMYRRVEAFGQSSGIRNPTTGRYALNEVADAIESIAGKPYEGIANNALYRNLILFPKATAQMAKTILSVFTHARNFISAGAFSVANGILPGINITPKTVQTAWRSLQVAGPGTRMAGYEELYRRLARLGVVNTNARLGDFAQLLQDVNFGSVVAADRGLRGLLKPFSKIKNWTQDAYTAEDDFWKIATFIAERARLAKAYERAGVKLAQRKVDVARLLDEEAADIVRNNVPNYDYVSQFVRDFRKFPLGNFVSFPAEILRTSTNILARAIKEIRTPALRRIGWQRLLGMGFTTATVPVGATAFGKWLYDISAEELHAMKRFVPDWSKNSTIIPLKDENGDPKYIDFSHANAYDTLAIPFQAAINEVAEGRLNDEAIMNNFILGAMKGFGDLARPFISESMWAEALIDVVPIMGRGGKTAEGYTIYDKENETWGNVADKIFLHLLKAQMPGSLKQIGRIDYAITGIDTPFQAGEIFGGGPLGNWKWGKIGKYSESGQAYEILDEGLGIAGMRAVKLDIPRALNYKQAAYASGTRKSKSLFTKVALKAGPRSPEELVEAYINANRALFEVQKTMREDINAAKLLNLKPVDLYKSLARLPRKDLGSLQAGIFQPYTVSRTVIAGMGDNARKMRMPNPFFKVASFINRIANQLYRLRIRRGTEFPPFVNPFKIKPVSELPQAEPNISTTQNVPPVDANLISSTNVGQGVNQMSGLTRNQEALLSPSDKLIAQKQNQKSGIMGVV